MLPLSKSAVASAMEVAGIKLDDRTELGTSELVLNSRAKLVDGLTDGIRDNISPEEQKALEDRVEQLAANLLALRQGKAGDVITFDWLPDVGTLVVLNGEVKGNAIPGDDVYRALLRVWLGDHPTSAGLKKALLGQRD